MAYFSGKEDPKRAFRRWNSLLLNVKFSVNKTVTADRQSVNRDIEGRPTIFSSWGFQGEDDDLSRHRKLVASSGLQNLGKLHPSEAESHIILLPSKK